MSFRTTQRKTGVFLTLEVTISITYVLLGEMGGRGEDPGLVGQRGLRPPNTAVPTQEGASGVWPFQNLYEVKPDRTKVLVSHRLLPFQRLPRTRSMLWAQRRPLTQGNRTRSREDCGTL